MDFEYAAAILVVLGLVAGVGIAVEDSVRVIVSALMLAGLSGALMSIPGVGEPLTKIYSALGTFATGAALMLFTRNMWNRYKP
jgi:hypothetical protein